MTPLARCVARDHRGRPWRPTCIGRVQRDRLDRDHLRRWATELGVADLLERAEREA